MDKSQLIGQLHGIARYQSVPEQIMERIMRLDPQACVRMRPQYPPGENRWYVSTGRIMVTAGSGGFFPGESGATPEEAIMNTWKQILVENAVEDKFFLRYNCKSNVPIPGEDPQVWVKWSEEKDDWVDVEPTAKLLAIQQIPANRIRSLREQQMYDRC